MSRRVGVIGRASLVRTALGEGLEVVWLRWPDQDGDTLPDDGPGHLVDAPVLPLGDLNALAQLAPRLAERHAMELVLATSERGQLPAGFLNSALGLPGTALATVLAFLDKPRFRTLTAATATAPVRAVSFVPASTAPPMPAPLVVKPIAGAGSAAVAVLSHAADRTGWHAEHATDSGDWVAEELVPGVEYSVETLTLGRGRHEVLAVTEKHLFSGSLVEQRHVVPALLEPEVSDAVTAEVCAALDATGLAGGIGHTEVMVDGGVVRLIESHSRKGGDSIVDLVRLAIGHDLERLYCLALARGPEAVNRVLADGINGTPGGCAAVGFLRAEPGVVTAVQGVNAATAKAGVVEVAVSARVGDAVGPLRSSRDRVGRVLVRAATRSEALAVLDDALALLAVHTVPADAGAP